MSCTILVTGAGTGIGALSSVSLAAAGHTVYASMREPDGRNAARAQHLKTRAADVEGELRVIELDVELFNTRPLFVFSHSCGVRRFVARDGSG
jgi:NAD(P)-dependent dehydrogenase (short-subunit alcohol dehydrogenase family)